MERDAGKPDGVGETLGEIFERLRRHVKESPSAEYPPTPSPQVPSRAPQADPGPIAVDADDGDDNDPGRYEGHLAEFPWFILDKKARRPHGLEPLVYKDTISAPDGTPVNRRWETHPSTKWGFGGPSTAKVLYELLQLYVEQGSTADHIHFATLRALCQRIYPDRHPSQDDRQRLGRDLDILCDYRFDCENAFYDRKKKAYATLRRWSLFTGWTGYTKAPRGQATDQEELPFGAIGVAPTLRLIAQSRGFFCIGFESTLFRELAPLEQRLAVYLAKMFISQTTHKRFVDDLAAALPIHVDPARPDNTRRTLKRAADGLLENKVPILKSFNFEKSREGRWLIVFHRARRPTQNHPIPSYAGAELAPAVHVLLEDVIAFTRSPQSRPWFIHCLNTLGADIGHFCFAQLKEACGIHDVKDRGALLTKIFKDKAGQLGKTLH
jgi:hypothetical protein